MNLFYYESKFKIIFLRGGTWGGGEGGGEERGGARVSEFFYKESKSIIFFWGGVAWRIDGQTNRPKPICPFNFFEVGGKSMLKSTSYVPVKLNL